MSRKLILILIIVCVTPGLSQTLAGISADYGNWPKYGGTGTGQFESQPALSGSIHLINQEEMLTMKRYTFLAFSGLASGSNDAIGKSFHLSVAEYRIILMCFGHNGYFNQRAGTVIALK